MCSVLLTAPKHQPSSCPLPRKIMPRAQACSSPPPPPLLLIHLQELDKEHWTGTQGPMSPKQSGLPETFWGGNGEDRVSCKPPSTLNCLRSLHRGAHGPSLSGVRVAWLLVSW